VVRHTNQLSVPTVVHLHGGATPSDSDGFPTDMVLPGQTRTYMYPNNRRAATLWYHDHAMDHTGRNIYMGLAGLYLVHDDEEQSLGLPSGPYDVPLFIQDRKFAPDGSLSYQTLNHLGAKGGVILVNGAPWPHMEVAARKYRFRIVNACNATPLRLALSSGQPLLQIATDGGLLPSPVRCPNIPLVMAERTEIVIDFSIYPVGTKLILQNLNIARQTGPIAREIMLFHVVRQEPDDSVVSERLCEFEPIDPATAKRTRHFVLSAKPSFGFVPIVNWKINGKAFDPDQPIASPISGDVEIWRFTNRRFLGLLSLVHPVHVHLVSFLILERNGRPPLPHETGWKDTVAVDKDEDVSVIARFDPYPGKYLLHCHNLEHEDHSMMARFDVVKR
jgi:spore coat protein A